MKIDVFEKKMKLIDAKVSAFASSPNIRNYEVATDHIYPAGTYVFNIKLTLNKKQTINDFEISNFDKYNTKVSSSELTKSFEGRATSGEVLIEILKNGWLEKREIFKDENIYVTFSYNIRNMTFKVKKTIREISYYGFKKMMQIALEMGSFVLSSTLVYEDLYVLRTPLEIKG